MSITHHQEDLLPDIPFNGLDEQIFAALARDSKTQALSGTLSFFRGKVKIRWSVDPSGPSAKATLMVLGFKVATVEIDTAKPCASMQGSFKIVKWNLQFCLDVAQRQLKLDGVISVKFLGSKKFNVALVSF